MTPGITVTVVGPGRAMDVTLPAAVPLALVVSSVVRLVGGEPAAQPRSWTLVRDLGGRLDLERSPADNQVAEGEILLLRDASAGPAEPVHRDLVDVITATADTATARWSTRGTRLFAAGLAVTTGPVIAAAAAGLGQGVAPVAAGATAAGLTAAVLTMRRRLDRALGAVWLMVLVTAWSSLAWSVATEVVDPLGRLVIAVGAGALVGVFLGRFVVPVAAEVAAGLGVVGLLAAAAVGAAAGLAAAGLATGVAVAVVGGTIGFVVLLAADLIPVFAVSAGRLSAVADDTVTGAAGAAVRRRVAATDSYATATAWGLAVAGAVGVIVLVRIPDPFELWLGATVGAGLLAQARAHSAVSRVLAPALAGGVALVAVGLSALTAPPATRTAVLVIAVLLAATAVVVTLGTPSAALRIRLGRWLDRLDKMFIFACPALIVGVAGGYPVVANWF